MWAAAVDCRTVQTQAGLIRLCFPAGNLWENLIPHLGFSFSKRPLTSVEQPGFQTCIA